MSLLAGAISRTDKDLPPTVRLALAANLSRRPGESIETYGGGRWFLAKADVGAYRSKGSLAWAGASTFVMAGEPLLSGERYRSCGDRAAEARLVYEALSSGRTDALEAATGTYCGALYRPEEHRLTLVSDKLGVRPIYYCVMPDFAVFATALRILEAANLIGNGIDLRGTYETSAFGFPFGERTAYRDVRAIGPAQLVHLTKDGAAGSTYFHWDRLEVVDAPEDAVIARLVASFEQGVRRRLRQDKAVLSFLSGGLDSRAIVAALRRQNVRVFTVNFAPQETQDRVYGELAAKALGSSHYQLDVAASRARTANREEHLRGWVDSLVNSGFGPERPGCIWSGDGGSVGLGHVYMDDATLALLAHGDLDGAARSFLHFNRLPGAANSVMTAEFRARTRDWHVDAVRSELAALAHAPEGRPLYLFLLQNDQRRHLANHFENIDVHRFEFHLPFFDSEFLEIVAQSPVRPFMGHRLYHRWLRALSPEAASVLWQAYPNHEPCPLPDPGALRYQWTKNYFGRTEERRLARAQGLEGLSFLMRGHFPRHLLSRPSFAAAVMFSLLGSNSYSHVTRVGTTFARAWHHAQQSGPRQ